MFRFCEISSVYFNRNLSAVDRERDEKIIKITRIKSFLREIKVLMEGKYSWENKQIGENEWKDIIEDLSPKNRGR